MNKWFYPLLLAIIMLPASQLAAQDLTKANVNWKYQPDAPLQLYWDVYQPAGKKPVLLLEVQLSQPARTKSLSGQIHYRDSLLKSSSLRTEPLFSSISKGESVQRFQYNLDTTRGANWAVLELQHTTDSLRTFWYALDLKVFRQFGLPSFYLQQQNNTLLAPFTLVTEGITPAFDKGAPADSLYMFLYEMKFAPAATPMTMAPTAAGSKMEISQKRKVAANQPLPTTAEGFYFLQKDTTSLRGQGIRTENKYFPKTRTLPSFSAPIRYLSTNEEWTELERENFSKQAVDRFWLRMTQSEDKARKIIRSYYRRVAQANKLFTSFKEGWKTDMGMIYVLYGPPEKVRLTNEGEVWQYTAKGDIPEISFTFVRSFNPFDPNYFQLARNKDYARTHFQIVSKWRRGQNLP